MHHGLLGHLLLPETLGYCGPAGARPPRGPRVPLPRPRGSHFTKVKRKHQTRTGSACPLAVWPRDRCLWGRQDRPLLKVEPLEAGGGSRWGVQSEPPDVEPRASGRRHEMRAAGRRCRDPGRAWSPPQVHRWTSPGKCPASEAPTATHANQSRHTHGPGLPGPAPHNSLGEAASTGATGPARPAWPLCVRHGRREAVRRRKCTATCPALSPHPRGCTVSTRVAPSSPRPVDGRGRGPLREARLQDPLPTGKPTLDSNGWRDPHVLKEWDGPPGPGPQLPPGQTRLKGGRLPPRQKDATNAATWSLSDSRIISSGRRQAHAREDAVEPMPRWRGRGRTGQKEPVPFL